MSRPYTGFDNYAAGKLKGTEEFIRQFIKLTNGAFFNNGSYGRRAIRGGAKPSVHGTGRAFDLSYRGSPYNGCGDRKVAEKWINWLIEHADELEIEMVVDYMPKPFGKAWRCDRGWKKYLRKTVSGGGKSWADWIHVEISPKYASNAQFYRNAFAKYSGDTITESIPPRRELKPYRGKPIRRGEKDRELVKLIQRLVGAKVDGIFGRKTEAAVMKWQAKNGCYPDGWIGSQTWAAMAPHFK